MTNFLLANAILHRILMEHPALAEIWANEERKRDFMRTQFPTLWRYAA